MCAIPTRMAQTQDMLMRPQLRRRSLAERLILAPLGLLTVPSCWLRANHARALRIGHSDEDAGPDAEDGLH
jgi:hypothetical protein